MHQAGLAIDFKCNGGSMAGSACFTWLTKNAAKYGLKNFSLEPWHWSTNGQ
jgi:D-alanyl-D-alanine carboxypeptidase